MRTKRLAAAQKVAAQLFAAEQEIDSAVTSTAGLILRVLEARSDACLPAVIGQDALDKLGVAVNGLLACRRQVVEAHRDLDVAGAQIGLKDVSWGDQFPKPPPRASEPAPLRAVG